MPDRTSAQISAEGKSDWRQLCAAAATEQDSAKLTSLVNQLIQALDERNPAYRVKKMDGCPSL